MSSTNGKVEPSELYPTPPEVVDALLAKLTLRETDTFLEPCYGTGAIFDKVDLPLSQKSYAEIEMGVDYLTTDFGTQDVIITNPPFSLTEEFIRKSLSELAPDGTMAYLQRVNYLGSKKGCRFGLKWVFQIKRQSLSQDLALLRGVQIPANTHGSFGITEIVSTFRKL
ncbi:hypothetical protein VAE122_2970169 [Vibrio aestuarianus]|nr:hypothetical protein VAE122_2970169 [Vibrio aestuarianus]